MNCFLELRFSDAPIQSWEWLIPEGETFSPDYEPFHFSAEFGHMSFLDQSSYEKLKNIEKATKDALWDDFFDPLLTDPNFSPEQERYLSYTKVSLSSDSPNTIAICESGGGNGEYFALAGLDEHNNTVCLVVPFEFLGQE